MKTLAVLVVVASMAASAQMSSAAMTASVGLKPLGPLCTVKSISYQLYVLGPNYLVRFQGQGSCDGSANPWTIWSVEGNTSNGWTLDVRTYRRTLQLPVKDFGRVTVSYTVGDDAVGHATCSFRPNFKYGYNAVVPCG